MIFGCFILTSFSPSLDGRAIVANEGEMPQGVFAKTVGYLPGDSIGVTNLTNKTTIDVLVIGALDPSEGVAILLSPEAAKLLNIEKDSNHIVKITKRSGQLDQAVSVLLEKGANPNVRNANGETPIFNAIKTDSTSTIDLLMKKGSEKNARDYLGNTPLHACVRWDSKNSAMKLIQWKADLDVQNLAGKTPLAQAARSGRMAMVTLLTENGANIDATDATGKNVLIDAIQSGKLIQ